jgi:hypothetical protein
MMLRLMQWTTSSKRKLGLVLSARREECEYGSSCSYLLIF